ncbi:MAG: TRAP transporter substrate-binding protein DctP [Syntrophales bacterium]|jgi:C4-dicarboxylate-binding protein DctP|nr:TRAP transporter substrate-binding protein DctP [Syntrophales bacterium]
MKRISVAVFAFVLAVMIGYPAFAAEKVIEFKISVDSNENHHRNKGLHLFIDLLTKNSHGRLKPLFFHSAQLYKDKDIPKALKMGTVDMGLPGIWQLEGVASSTAITALPMFYGLPEKVTKDLVDGEAGGMINRDIEKKMGVKVLGKWAYHGYLDTGTRSKAIKDWKDFSGLKIRHPGGAANAIRMETFGASPILIPWPDLPMAMVQGTADGCLTTLKSFESAKLWDTGLKFITKDHEYYLHNIPVVSMIFWNKLPKDLQKIMMDTWEEHIEKAREIVDNEQRNAETILKKNGVQIYDPPEADLMKWREKAMTAQASIVKELKLDTSLVSAIEKIVNDSVKKK